MEGTAAFAVTALNAGIGLNRQLVIVSLCHLVACKSKVIILIYQPYVQLHGAWLAGGHPLTFVPVTPALQSNVYLFTKKYQVFSKATKLFPDRLGKL